MKSTLLCGTAALCTSVISLNRQTTTPLCHTCHSRHRPEGTVIDDIDSPDHVISRILSRIFISGKKKKLLERYSWYRTVTGGWAHPHAIDFMTRHEIMKLSHEQLEYKLKHGSQAILPEYLKNRKDDTKRL